MISDGAGPPLTAPTSHQCGVCGLHATMAGKDALYESRSESVLVLGQHGQGLTALSLLPHTLKPDQGPFWVAEERADVGAERCTQRLLGLQEP